jgi:hypothetical protein
LYARHQKTATVQINNNSTINANNIEQLYQTGVAHFGIDSEHAQQSQRYFGQDNSYIYVLTENLKE